MDKKNKRDKSKRKREPSFSEDSDEEAVHIARASRFCQNTLQHSSQSGNCAGPSSISQEYGSSGAELRSLDHLETDNSSRLPNTEIPVTPNVPGMILPLVPMPKEQLEAKIWNKWELHKKRMQMTSDYLAKLNAPAKITSKRRRSSSESESTGPDVHRILERVKFWRKEEKVLPIQVVKPQPRPQVRQPSESSSESSN